jgi:hypothetical protein
MNLISASSGRSVPRLCGDSSLSRLQRTKPEKLLKGATLSFYSIAPAPNQNAAAFDPELILLTRVKEVYG